LLNFALLGCGRISRKHAEILGGKQLENGRLAAVCDVQVARARALGEEFGVPYFPSLEAMMDKMHAQIDVVNILTPSGMHAKNCLAVAKYGKHVVVEKPMALTLQDADAMIRACALAGVRIFVVKQNRYNMPVQKLREAIETKRFGKLVMGTVRVRWCRTQEYYDQDPWRGTWAQDGGVLTNQASHHIDLLEWMMGDVDSVFAKSTTALVDIEVEDTALAVLKFSNGALGLIEATTAARPKDLEGSISVLGEKGTVEIGGFAVNEMKLWSFSDQLPGDAEVLKVYRENPKSVYGFGHLKYLENVVECIDTGKSAMVDGLEGRKSLELINALYESIETGREVFMRFKPVKCKLGIV
jgi:UDP-N-acetyl-2-amino-2-deoxyglucuronate dehydrogenase